MNVEDTLTKYIELNKTLSSLRKQQKEIKDQVTQMERDIHEYMTENNMDSINLKDGEIVLYTKKISQTFKKDTIVEKLAEKLQDQTKAEDIAMSILENKKYTTKQQIKAVLKKK